MTPRIYNVRQSLAKGLPELILDRSDPRFLRADIIEARMLHATHELAHDTTGKLSTVKVAQKFQVPVEPLRDTLKDYHAEDRVLTDPQEQLLCQRLDRLTRYGGIAKAVEEPARVQDLITKYTIGVLRLLEHTDLRVTYQLRPGWVENFLERHPQYRVHEHGAPAPQGSAHATTNAHDHWLLGSQKAALYNILEKHYSLRSSKGLEEYWKAVKRDAKKEVGYDFGWADARNETLQQKHRQHCPERLKHTVLGKRKRDEPSEGGKVAWQIWDAACHDFLKVDLAIYGKVDPPPCSPPPGLDVPEETRPPPPDLLLPEPQHVHPHYGALDNCHTQSGTQYAQNGNHYAQNGTQYVSQPEVPAAQPSHDYSSYIDNGYVPVGDSWTDSAQPYRATAPGCDEEDRDIRLANATGTLAQAGKPNAAATSRLYHLPERLLREHWAPRKTRQKVATARLLKDQEARLRERLDRLVNYGGTIGPVEHMRPDGSPSDIIQAYANGILAEDDQLVEGNMLLHAAWAEEFVERNPRYAASGGRRRA